MMVMPSANGIDPAGCSRPKKGIRPTPSGRALRCNLRCAPISAAIPVGSARWRSLRALLAKDKGEAVPLPKITLPVVDVPSSHTCSRQQPCGSSGRSAPSGLAQGGLGRAVKVADREVGLARTPDPPSVSRAGPSRGAGASARRSQAARRTPASTQGIARMQRRASIQKHVPGRVLPAARLERILVTSVIPTTPRRASPGR